MSTNRRWKNILAASLLCYAVIWFMCLTEPTGDGVNKDNVDEISLYLRRDKEGADVPPPINSATGNGFPPLTMAPKNVLIYGTIDEMMSWPELHLFRDVFTDNITKTGNIECKSHATSLKFFVSNNVTDFIGKDVVIFGMLGKAFKDHVGELINTKPYPNQTWVYFSTEPPHRIVKWTQNFKFKELKYHIMMTYRRDSEVQIPFGIYKERSEGSAPFDKTEIDRALQSKSKFIYWMGSNCGEVYWPRMGYINHLKRHLPLETFGRCGEQQCLPIRSEECLNRLSTEFKFSLSIANSECTDYITEKLWTNALSKHIIPVVYGAPKENYEKIAPPNSFIHISDFNTTEELAKYLMKVADNDNMYRKYFEWKKTYEVKSSFPVHPQQLCQLVPHLYNGTQIQLKRIGDSLWYNGCRTKVTKATLRGVSPQVQREKFDEWDIWRL